MPSNRTKSIALGGVLAAVAVVIICLGGYVPVATYVCPMLCTVTQFLVLRFCGNRIARTWFAAVSILSLLLGPDKEAAIVFLAVGYYPLVKFKLERCKLAVVLKLLLFNTAIVAAYGSMIYLLGMIDVAAESTEIGIIGLAAILLMGNITFLLLDRLLSIISRKLH